MIRFTIFDGARIGIGMDSNSTDEQYASSVPAIIWFEPFGFNWEIEEGEVTPTEHIYRGSSVLTTELDTDRLQKICFFDGRDIFVVDHNGAHYELIPVSDIRGRGF